MEALENYIQVFDSVVPHSLCDMIIDEYGCSDDWVEAGVEFGVDKSARDVDFIGISDQRVLSKNTELRSKIDSDLFQCASKSISKYLDLFPAVKVDSDSGYELLRYKEGQFYLQHVDAFKKEPRVVSCSFALNDDYDGGEWAFFDKRVAKKIPKGSAILFPSNFMYPHQILPVTKGVRYSVVTWFL